MSILGHTKARNQKLQFGSLMWVAGTHMYEVSSAVFPVADFQGAGSEAELGLEASTSI